MPSAETYLSRSIVIYKKIAALLFYNQSLDKQCSSEGTSAYNKTVFAWVLTLQQFSC